MEPDCASHLNFTHPRLLIQPGEIRLYAVTHSLVCHSLEPWVWITDMNGHSSPHYSAVWFRASVTHPSPLTWFPSYCHPWLTALPSCLLSSIAPPPDPLFLCAVAHLEQFLHLPAAHYRCSHTPRLPPPSPPSPSLSHCSVSNGSAPSQQIHQVDAGCERQPWLTPPNGGP